MFIIQGVPKKKRNGEFVAILLKRKNVDDVSQNNP